MNKICILHVLVYVLVGAGPLFAQTEQAGVLVKFKDEITPFHTTGVFLVPGEKMKIETVFEARKETYLLLASDGTVNSIGRNVWEWVAPSEKGIYPVKIFENGSSDTIILNCIVMIPFSQLKGTSLNNYKIGEYPSSSNELYTLPKGFIEVTKENEHTLVSPHYRLKDFLCKQAGNYPKYVVLKERGIIKLEMVQNHLKSEGIEFDKFSFISGYRTPYYNKAIGNVRNSRHIFGDAYDVYIDQVGDNQMDDLNKDGVVNIKDVQFLYNKINSLYGQTWYQPFIGGLGLYGPNSRRTGYIHLDTRGYRARWGS